ncbi:MAG: phosphodiester glycosidase family protein, partial [Roseiflexaceae bacterium]
PGAAGRPAFPLTIVRLDPAQVRLRVAYAPEQPQALRAWFDETQPLVAINGGFFKEDYHGTALVISDGQASGPSYEGFGGMLAVTPDGGVSLQALSDQPYDPAEPLAQAMQSFPMLVFPGGASAEINDNGARARRSAIAMDRDGHLLLIVSPTSEFTLRDLAGWLSHSDLAIDRALNLDGGSSTGLFVGAGDAREQIDSFGPLPLVLLVKAK